MNKLFDFDNTPDRRGTNCVKWDEAAEGVLPLWVADMDFATAPCVQQAVIRRAQHPCYGYTLVPEAYYEAIQRWFAQRHDWQIGREEILYTIGVVPAIAAILKAVCQVGDNVAMLTPIYNCFYSNVRNAGCQMVSVPLKVKSEKTIVKSSHLDEQDNTSHPIPVSSLSEAIIDWEALEVALAHEKTTVLLLCNPHNPVGRIWSKKELQHIAQLCQKYHVTVISDEIHNELTAPGTLYTPWGTIGQEYQSMAAICTSPSKSFNIAGLQNANIVVRDAELRRKIDRAINLNETCDVSPFGVEAVIAAYNEGGDWLDALRQYIWDNYDFARAYINKELPQLSIVDLQATYLMWVDCRSIEAAMARNTVNQEVNLSQRLQDEAKVWFTAGHVYGEEGRGWLRINLATSRAVLAEALTRFVQWVKSNHLNNE